MVARRAHRRYPLLLTLAICSGGLVVGTTAALAGSTFTWSGDDTSSANWSLADNWAGTAPSVADSGDSLVFPANLSGGDCAAAQTDACYIAEDNLSGYAVNSLSIDDGDGYFIAPDNADDPLTIDSGGITANTSSSSFNPAEFALPIVLGANQTWSVNGGGDGSGQLSLDAGVSGSSTLGIHLTDQGFVELDDGSNSEVGAVAVAGTSSANSGAEAIFNGALELDVASLNATDESPVTLDDATILGSGSVGNLISDGGQIAPGDPTGGIAVNGNVSFDQDASFAYSAFSPMIIDAGTTPGTDYSQLTATGTVTLGFAKLEIAAGNDTDSCPTLNLGAVYTLISAHSIVGYLGTLGGATGSESTMVCSGGNAPVFNIAYNTSTSPETVTATVVGPVATTYTDLDAPGPDPPDSGQSVTLEASVQADTWVTDALVAPVGTVEFDNNGTPIAGCTNQALNLGGGSAVTAPFWQATCTTTASQTVGPYSYQARFNPTDTQTGGQLASVSTEQTGQIIAFSLYGGTASLGDVTIKGLVASLPLSCTGLPGESCSDVTATLSVAETLKDGKVVAVAAKAKPKTMKRTVVVGSGSTPLGIGGSTTLQLQLNGAGQALLKTRHRLSAELSVTSGESVLSNQTLTFTESAPKKKKH